MCWRLQRALQRAGDVVAASDRVLDESRCARVPDSDRGDASLSEDRHERVDRPMSSGMDHRGSTDRLLDTVFALDDDARPLDRDNAYHPGDHANAGFYEPAPAGCSRERAHK